MCKSRSTLFLWRHFEILRRFRRGASREIRTSGKIRNVRLNMDVDVSQESTTALFLQRIDTFSLHFFSLSLSLYETHSSRNGNIGESVLGIVCLSRDTIVVVNSVDLFYATCKLLPLLSLSHEQRSSEIPVVHGVMALRFNDMCEICNILRNSWYISRVTPAGSWSAPAVDTSAIYRRR